MTPGATARDDLVERLEHDPRGLFELPQLVGSPDRDHAAPCDRNAASARSIRPGDLGNLAHPRHLGQEPPLPEELDSRGSVFS